MQKLPPLLTLPIMDVCRLYSCVASLSSRGKLLPRWPSPTPGPCLSVRRPWRLLPLSTHRASQGLTRSLCDVTWETKGSSTFQFCTCHTPSVGCDQHQPYPHYAQQPAASGLGGAAPGSYTSSPVMCQPIQTAQWAWASIDIHCRRQGFSWL